MEIERKYLIHKLPDHLEAYPHRTLEQAYLCTEPVVRVRRDADDYILTYKSKGLMMREEHNLPLTEEALLPSARKGRRAHYHKRTLLHPLRRSSHDRA